MSNKYTIILYSFVLLLLSRCREQDNQQLSTEQQYAKKIESCPIDWGIIEKFTPKMEATKDSLKMALQECDTSMVAHHLIVWEGLYADYLYNVFREMNLRFHEDTLYENAYIFIESDPDLFLQYTNAMSYNSKRVADAMSEYLIWRSELECKKAEKIVK